MVPAILNWHQISFLTYVLSFADRSSGTGHWSFIRTEFVTGAIASMPVYTHQEL